MVMKSQIGLKNSQVKSLVIRGRSSGNVGGKSTASVTGRSVVSISQGKSLSRMKVRKRSYGFAGVPGIRTAEQRTSQLGTDYKRPPLIYLNTYQLDPHVKFHVPSVEKAINEVLDDFFTEHKYSSSQSPGLTLIIAGEVMRRVKGFGFNRYRIISVVTIAQKRAQSYNNAVAFLWDHTRDGIVNMQREVPSAFIQATVFGIYLD